MAKKQVKKQGKKHGIPELSEAVDMNIRDTREICIDIVKFLEGLPVGDKLAIPKLGIFEKIVKQPRNARNPRTGETFMTKKKIALKFKFSSNLRDL